MADFTLTKSESKDFEAVPENAILEAEVVEVKVQEAPWLIDKEKPELGKDQQVNFRFKISEDEPYTWETTEEDGTVTVNKAANRTLFGGTSTNFTTHPDCRLRVWVQEILNVDIIPENFTLSSDDDTGRIEALEGLPVKVVVGNYFKDNTDGTKTAKDKVVDVIRVGGFKDADEIF